MLFTKNYININCSDFLAEGKKSLRLKFIDFICWKVELISITLYHIGIY